LTRLFKCVKHDLHREGGNMKPTRQDSKNLKSSSSRKLLMKGDIPMGKTFSIAVAIVIVTASWGNAGNLKVLADAGTVRAPAPLYIKPGALVKAEFKSSVKATSDEDADSLFPEEVSSGSDPEVNSRPAIAFRDRTPGTTAPSPRTAPKSPASMGSMAEALKQAAETEEDISEKLVIPPSSGKIGNGIFKKPPRKSKAAQEEASLSEQTIRKKARPAKHTRTRRGKTPSEYRSRAKSQRPIRKVRALTAKNPWAIPAGSSSQHSTCFESDCRNAHRSTHEDLPPSHLTSNPRRIAPPPSAERFVRDGVPIRLAPAAAPAGQPYPAQESYEDDVFSAATEIITLPFAFISSFF
jgi:hypothetical protein